MKHATAGGVEGGGASGDSRVTVEDLGVSIGRVQVGVVQADMLMPILAKT
jgi:hypothetical protein